MPNLRGRSLQDYLHALFAARGEILQDVLRYHDRNAVRVHTDRSTYEISGLALWNFHATGMLSFPEHAPLKEPKIKRNLPAWF